jgi:hypothetical protein
VLAALGFTSSADRALLTTPIVELATSGAATRRAAFCSAMRAGIARDPSRAVVTISALGDD